MKRIFAFIIIAFLAQVVQAQVTISGTVTDIGGSPLSGAIVKTLTLLQRKCLHFVILIVKENSV